MSKMVLIEYTADHEANAGRVEEDDKAFTIEEGTQRYVDAASAKSLVKKKKAKIVKPEVKQSEPVDEDPDDQGVDESDSGDSGAVLGSGAN